MILAVVGSRKFADYHKLKETLDAVRTPIKMLVSGGADGADTLAQRYAKEKGLPITIFYPDTKKYGKGAYHRRNEQIVAYCDNLVAFWVGGSTGTAHAISLADEAGKKVFTVLDLDNQTT